MPQFHLPCQVNGPDSGGGGGAGEAGDFLCYTHTLFKVKEWEMKWPPYAPPPIA